MVCKKRYYQIKVKWLTPMYKCRYFHKYILAYAAVGTRDVTQNDKDIVK